MTEEKKAMTEEKIAMSAEKAAERKPAKVRLKEIAEKATQDAWDAKKRGEKIGSRLDRISAYIRSI